MSYSGAAFLVIVALCWIIGASVKHPAEGAGIGVVLGAVVLWWIGGWR